LRRGAAGPRNAFPEWWPGRVVDYAGGPVAGGDIDPASSIDLFVIEQE
jgi:hypothetical protein